MNAVSSADDAEVQVKRGPLMAALTSSIGLKAVMAVTGIALSLFVLGHMTGNLLSFKGPEALNAYGAGLRKLGALLWVVRAGLLGMVLLHIWAYLLLTRRSLGARPVGYRTLRPKESTYASRTMRWTGPLLGAFIVYHLLHLTIGSAMVHPGFVEGDVYHNLVTGLSVAPVAIFYVLAMLALAFHLWHGVWSLFQTLGANHPRYDKAIRGLATVFTIIVVTGFLAIPLAVLAGVLKLG